MERIRFASI